MPPDKGVEIVRADPLIYTWLGTPFSRIITIARSIESDWDGDDSFCGGSHVRQTWDGCHLDPPGAQLGKSPKRQLRNATLAPCCSYYASCAAARGAAVVALGSQTLGMTYRIPWHIRVALPIVGKGLSKGPLCVVEWSRGRGAYCYSCFVHGRL
jgi:hypothetical protein